jgi:hypothetical protein
MSLSSLADTHNVWRGTPTDIGGHYPCSEPRRHGTTWVVVTHGDRSAMPYLARIETDHQWNEEREHGQSHHRRSTQGMDTELVLDHRRMAVRIEERTMKHLRRRPKARAIGRRLNEARDEIYRSPLVGQRMV